MMTGSNGKDGGIEIVSGETFEVGDGQTLVNVHWAETCQGRWCVIHNPMDHSMRGMPLHWRSDRQIFERICSHQVGHPDPSQFDYWDSRGQSYNAIHGCCLYGCCATKEYDEN